MTVRNLVLAAAIIYSLVSWLIDRQILQDAVQYASEIVAAARER